MRVLGFGASGLRQYLYESKPRRQTSSTLMLVTTGTTALSILAQEIHCAVLRINLRHRPLDFLGNSHGSLPKYGDPNVDRLQQPMRTPNNGTPNFGKHSHQRMSQESCRNQVVKMKPQRMRV